MPHYLFIGGAPRSGTTLLVWLFDWHPQVFIFPKEDKVLQTYWPLPENGKDAVIKQLYKEVQFLAPAFAEEKRSQLRAEFGAIPSYDVDYDRFQEQFAYTLERGDGSLLDRIFTGLAVALWASNNEVHGRYNLADHAPDTRPKYLLFKNPYFVELYAQNMAGLLPESRFIHIVRSPIDRYLSSKARWGQTKRLKGRLNGVDPVTGLCEVWASSQWLARENQRILGEDRYHIIHYEDLIATPESVMRSTAAWLGIQFTDSLLKPTELSHPASANSSFEAGSAAKIQTTASQEERLRRYLTLGERTIIHYLLNSISDYLDEYSIPPVTKTQARVAWLNRFNGESWRSFARRLLSFSLNPTIMSEEKLHRMLLQRLPELARSSPVRVA